MAAEARGDESSCSEVTLTAELLGCLFSLHYSETGSNNHQLKGYCCHGGMIFYKMLKKKQ